MEAACGVPALPPPPPGRHLPRRRPSAPRVHRAWTDQRTHWCTPRAGEALVVRLDRGSSNLRGACESPQTRGSCPWKRWRSAQASTSVATQTTSATSAHGDQHPGEHPRRPVGAGPRRWPASPGSTSRRTSHATGRRTRRRAPHAVRRRGTPGRRSPAHDGRPSPRPQCVAGPVGARPQPLVGVGDLDEVDICGAPGASGHGPWPPCPAIRT
jgi:hypothetical protein